MIDLNSIPGYEDRYLRSLGADGGTDTRINLGLRMDTDVATPGFWDYYASYLVNGCNGANHYVTMGEGFTPGLAFDDAYIGDGTYDTGRNYLDHPSIYTCRITFGLSSVFGTGMKVGMGFGNTGSSIPATATDPTFLIYADCATSLWKLVNYKGDGSAPLTTTLTGVAPPAVGKSFKVELIYDPLERLTARIGRRTGAVVNYTGNTATFPDPAYAGGLSGMECLAISGTNAGNKPEVGFWNPRCRTFDI